jgi:hypothetical protein
MADGNEVRKRRVGREVPVEKMRRNHGRSWAIELAQKQSKQPQAW